MAKQVTTTSLLNRISSQLTAIHEEVKTQQPTYGNPTLPAGIEGGIAQLKEMKFGEYKEGEHKGQIYFMASGIVVEPHSVTVQTLSGPREVPILGLRTQIGPHPLCDTPKSQGKLKTLKDHYSWVLNQIQIFGIDATQITPQTLERTVELLKQAQPYFRFRTWQGKKQSLVQRGNQWFLVEVDMHGREGRVVKGPFSNEQQAKTLCPYAGREPMVTHEWNGICDYTPPDDVQISEVEDNTGNGEVPSSNNHSSQEVNVRDNPASYPFDQVRDIDTADMSYEELVGHANNGNGHAQEAIMQRAKDAGVTDEQVAGATTWDDVVALIVTLQNAANTPTKVSSPITTNAPGNVVNPPVTSSTPPRPTKRR